MLDDSAGFCKYPYGNKARDHKIPSPQAADGAGSGTHNEQTPVSSVLLAPTPLCAHLCVCGHCGGVGKVQEAP